MMKRLLSAILVVVLCLGAFPLSTAAASEEQLLTARLESVDRATFDVNDNLFYEVEPNDDFNIADRIYNDYTVYGDVSGYDVDVFKFSTSGSVSIAILTVGNNSHLITGVYNSSEEILGAAKTSYSDGNYSSILDGTLTGGTYYIVLLNDSEYYSNEYGFYLYYTSGSSSHTHSYTSRVTPATCTSGGYTTYTCSCGYSYTGNSTTALGHNYRTSTVAPTCENEGYTLKSCTRCSYSTKSNYTAAVGHNYEASTVAPTCTEQGYDQEVCSKCSDTYKYNFVSALGHTYSDDSGIYCTVCGEIDSGVTYPDVKRGQWYYTAVHYVTFFGFMSGYQNGKFGPADNLQRQDFVVALARIANADLTPYMNSNGGLKDVVKGSYYAPAVAWAVDQGIITGYQNGKFGVGDTVTREQVATIFYRYIGSPKVENVMTTLSSYPDFRRISSFAQIPMAWAIQNNVISGMQNGSLSPTTGASRAQIATIMMRMNEAGMFDPVPEEPIEPEEPVDPEEPVEPEEPIDPAA